MESAPARRASGVRSPARPTIRRVSDADAPRRRRRPLPSSVATFDRSVSVSSSMAPGDRAQRHVELAQLHVADAARGGDGAPADSSPVLSATASSPKRPSRRPSTVVSAVHRASRSTRTSPSARTRDVSAPRCPVICALAAASWPASRERALQGASLEAERHPPFRQLGLVDSGRLQLQVEPGEHRVEAAARDRAGKPRREIGPQAVAAQQRAKVQGFQPTLTNLVRGHVGHRPAVALEGDHTGIGPDRHAVAEPFAGELRVQGAFLDLHVAEAGRLDRHAGLHELHGCAPPALTRRAERHGAGESRLLEQRAEVHAVERGAADVEGGDRVERMGGGEQSHGATLHPAVEIEDGPSAVESGLSDHLLDPASRIAELVHLDPRGERGFLWCGAPAREGEASRERGHDRVAGQPSDVHAVHRPCRTW